MAKDLFSQQSDLYARYRPTYPKELYDHILSFVKEKNIVWDCATGNGQAAVVLADHFRKVIATISGSARTGNPKDIIEYLVCTAEKLHLKKVLDLVTVAQA
jgi:ubiquinone/menaquinone biosynthesis C-methylase UbiE